MLGYMMARHGVPTAGRGRSARSRSSEGSNAVDFPDMRRTRCGSGAEEGDPALYRTDAGCYLVA